VCREFIVLCRDLKLFSEAIVAIDGISSRLLTIGIGTSPIVRGSSIRPVDFTILSRTTRDSLEFLGVMPEPHWQSQRDHVNRYREDLHTGQQNAGLKTKSYDDHRDNSQVG
jgi:hypothetical protein